MKKIFIALVVIFSFASCSKKEVKQDTYESKAAREAIALSETLKEAYLKKDITEMEKNSTKEGFREILGAIKGFDKAELTFTPKWIDIDDSTVSLKIAWSGKWVMKGETREERGTAVFIFEGSPMKLSRIMSANPFRQPE